MDLTKRTYESPKHIVITGASNGLGKALALHYAAAGVTLSLSGRNEARLDDVAALCREKGADVNAQIIDVTNAKAMHEWLGGLDSALPVDLVIANAGISGGTGDGIETTAQIRSIFDVNLTGVLNTIDPLLPFMLARKHGQIAIMSSLAGFRGFPGAPAYCASKAAVKSYGESLRGSLKHDGIAVNVICPGFVESAMTDVNDFPMPFKMSAERAAQIITKDLRKNKGRIAFPWPMLWMVRVLNILPDALTSRLLIHTPAKPQKPK